MIRVAVVRFLIPNPFISFLGPLEARCESVPWRPERTIGPALRPVWLTQTKTKCGRLTARDLEEEEEEEKEEEKEEEEE
ncbi:hypothetical protein Pmani_029684 [Petrolisthes manimaculis]|uniref:Uncharacterized protein n=1 Tax=Petrolisthes manimaculis TaxID=1843537 RepID=A0AAE1NYY0_9EUCA|nr:hypothetical protein Pmani_029684 [Petrolisthes manimaculis]